MVITAVYLWYVYPAVRPQWSLVYPTTWALFIRPSEAHLSSPHPWMANLIAIRTSRFFNSRPGSVCGGQDESVFYFWFLTCLSSKILWNLDIHAVAPAAPPTSSLLCSLICRRHRLEGNLSPYTVESKKIHRTCSFASSGVPRERERTQPRKLHKRGIYRVRAVGMFTSPGGGRGCWLGFTFRPPLQDIMLFQRLRPAINRAFANIYRPIIWHHGEIGISFPRLIRRTRTTVKQILEISTLAKCWTGQDIIISSGKLYFEF